MLCTGSRRSGLNKFRVRERGGETQLRVASQDLLALTKGAPRASIVQGSDVGFGLVKRCGCRHTGRPRDLGRVTPRPRPLDCTASRTCASPDTDFRHDRRS